MVDLNYCSIFFNFCATIDEWVMYAQFSIPALAAIATFMAVGVALWSGKNSERQIKEYRESRRGALSMGISHETFEISVNSFRAVWGVREGGVSRDLVARVICDMGGMNVQFLREALKNVECFRPEEIRSICMCISAADRAGGFSKDHPEGILDTRDGVMLVANSVYAYLNDVSLIFKEANKIFSSDNRCPEEFAKSNPVISVRVPG